MYFIDHNPPHFHAEYQGMRAEYNIKTLELIVGKLPNRAESLVLEWAQQHRIELMKNWEKAQSPGSMEKIEPLK